MLQIISQLFLLAKIERIFELTVRDNGDISDIFIGRSLILIAAFALGVLSTFIWRSDVSSQE